MAASQNIWRICILYTGTSSRTSLQGYCSLWRGQRLTEGNPQALTKLHSKGVRRRKRIKEPEKEGIISSVEREEAGSELLVVCNRHISLGLGKIPKFSLFATILFRSSSTQTLAVGASRISVDFPTYTWRGCRCLKESLRLWLPVFLTAA